MFEQSLDSSVLLPYLSSYQTVSFQPISVRPSDCKGTGSGRRRKLERPAQANRLDSLVWMLGNTTASARHVIQRKQAHKHDLGKARTLVSSPCVCVCVCVSREFLSGSQPPSLQTTNYKTIYNYCIWSYIRKKQLNWDGSKDSARARQWLCCPLLLHCKTHQWSANVLHRFNHFALICLDLDLTVNEEWNVIK